MAVGIALVLCGIAVVQVVRFGHVDDALLGALVILAFGFAGYGGDRLLQRWSGR